ncbi:hypothetical protein LCGC14_2551720 [marine sediment metagenome]|uniref:Uncharacterized protein n=1 Tax=marine sediment metagenome TaxID=412755 RepID=A0A0F9DFQ9_9ZZZZ
MESKQYCIGQYTKVQAGHQKRYVPTLVTTKGVLLRYSRNHMKTATFAKMWAKEWAKRVNKRAAGRYAITSPAIDRTGVFLEHRENCYFEELG